MKFIEHLSDREVVIACAVMLVGCVLMGIL